MHCNRRRLLRRELEFHMCTINERTHTKKVWKLIVCTSYLFFFKVLVEFFLLLHYSKNLYSYMRVLLTNDRELMMELGRYHQAMKNFIVASTKVHKRVDKGLPRIVFQHSLWQIKSEAVNDPGLNSRCIGETNVSRTTWFCLLKKVGTSMRLVTILLLIKTHIQKHLKWAEDNMKDEFSKVLFMDKSCALFDGSDD